MEIVTLGEMLSRLEEIIEDLPSTITVNEGKTRIRRVNVTPSPDHLSYLNTIQNEIREEYTEDPKLNEIKNDQYRNTIRKISSFIELIINDLEEFGVQCLKTNHFNAANKYVTANMPGATEKIPFEFLHEKIKKKNNELRELNEKHMLGKAKKSSKDNNLPGEELLEKTTDSIEEFLNYIRQNKSEIESETESLRETISAISENSLSIDFDEQAGKDKKLADFYRTASIITLSVIAGLSIFLYLSPTHEISSYIDLAVRFSTTLLMLLPCFYMIRESARHRGEEYKNRRISLTLKSLSSYLSDTHANTKDEIKSVLAREMFSDKENYNNSTETINLIKNIKDIIK